MNRLEGYAYGARYEVSGDTDDDGFLWELEYETLNDGTRYLCGTESTQSGALDAAERHAKLWHQHRMVERATDLLDEMREADVINDHRDLALKLDELHRSALAAIHQLEAYEADRR